jgi:hypothetical protein
MMLLVENWTRGGELELASLVDESPNPQFDAFPRGEPWRPDGPLFAAAQSALHGGCAKLFIVFKSDPLVTWGSKHVTVFAGGLLFAGVPQKRLRYEAVARQIFGTTLGRDASSEYRVLVSAEMTPDPEQMAQLGSDCDPFLGFPEPPNLTKVNAPKSVGLSLALGPGCKLTWIDQTGYSEIWFVADSQGFEEHRFLFTEYARRPYVQSILTILGFVTSRQANSTEDATKKTTLVQSHALLGGMLPFLTALQELTSSSHASDMVKTEKIGELDLAVSPTSGELGPIPNGSVGTPVKDQPKIIDIVELD